MPEKILEGHSRCCCTDERVGVGQIDKDGGGVY